MDKVVLGMRGQRVAHAGRYTAETPFQSLPVAAGSLKSAR
jgi:hypothetical protein